jgi:hypothetical protein
VFSAGLGGRLVVEERSVAAWRGRFEKGMELDDNERWKWTYVDQTRARTRFLVVGNCVRGVVALAMREETCKCGVRFNEDYKLRLELKTRSVYCKLKVEVRRTR